MYCQKINAGLDADQMLMNKELDQKLLKPLYEISNNVVCATSKGSDQPVHTCRLIRAFAGRLNIL